MFALKMIPFTMLLAIGLPTVGTGSESAKTGDKTSSPESQSVLQRTAPQKVSSILNDQSSREPATHKTEVLRTRYPSGAVQIERHVRRDQNDVPINHGKWTMYTPEGEQIGIGTFRDGRPHGKWSRTYRGPEANTMLGRSQQGFTLPLHSTTTFDDGLLHGQWMIVDDEQKKVRLWTFDQEKLHGDSVAWYPSGNRLREAKYDHGIPAGLHREWSPEGELLESNEFQYGRLLSEHSSQFDNGEVQSEGVYLLPRYRIATHAWWWDGKVQMSVTAKKGKRERTGLWAYYHENGKLAHTGEYLRNLPEGTHEWYHKSGNLKATGSYRAGKPNGQWAWFAEDGALTRSKFYVQEETEPQPAHTEGAKGLLAAETSEPDTNVSTVVPNVSKPKDSVQAASHNEPIPQTVDAKAHKNLQIRPAKQLR